MKKELEELLMADLCARIPYNIKGTVYNEGVYEINSISTDGIVSIPDYHPTGICFVNDFKPYLFPLSSMTEEQEEAYSNTLDCTKHWTIGTFDWFNKNHYDYRGLLWGGLAIDCTNLNIY